MEALINDQQIRDLQILLIQEPPLSAYRTHVNHPKWYRYQPTYHDDNIRKRSLIYVNKRISTSAHRQIHCDHPDVTAIKMWTEQEEILIFSIYIQPLDYHHLNEEQSMQETLDKIEYTIQEHRTATRTTTIILAGDFNRHHPAWSSGMVDVRTIVHSDELINFFHAHRLHWCLAKGNPTYWALHRPGKNSTIDLTLTNERQRLVKCTLYHDNYGSDHRGTLSEWNMQLERRPESQPRRAYERADWVKIGEQVRTKTKMRDTGRIESREQLDQVVTNLITQVQAAVEEHTPLARPSPYAKRWFTPALKTQQKEVNKLRRMWQESCASNGPADPKTMRLFAEMHSQRRQWTRAIEKTKKEHWREFLDQASSQTVWKTTPFLERQDGYAQILPLKVGNDEYADNPGKAQAFLQCFFPAMQQPPREVITPPKEIAWEPITEREISRVLKAAKKTTAPGKDKLPTLVSDNLWPYIASLVTRVFIASVDLGYYPTQWKIARIVVLRKPGKADYTIPESYRPISLLNTLGKLLEAVMAKRLSFYAETYKLLPDTQFGGRPGRTTEQALLVLANAINQAWLRARTVTLIAFDLKGAFNGVNSNTLDARLLERGIPTKARKWIQSFMRDRSASIQFDDFETEVEALACAGLAQGSPLSPILFAFFNADLVDQPVDTQGGASAFIDDYFRWRVGKSAEENLKKIQEEDIPRIMAWAQRTGSCFAPKKTELIHLTRQRKDKGKGFITMDGQTIKASTTAKLLGVIFDTEMRWKEHVQQAAKRATKTALGMSGLKHLRPAQMRQIYQACVLPKLDYASTVWHNPLKDKLHLRVLASVQRAALLRIISAFRTVATQTLEAECYLLPTHLRLKQRAQNVIARLCTLPEDQPLTKVMKRVKQRVKQKNFYPRFPFVEAMRTVKLDELEALETIDPRPRAPWKESPFLQIEIIRDQEVALAMANQETHSSGNVIFVDASAKDAKLGAGIVAINPQTGPRQTRQVGIGSASHWNIHIAELIATHQAVEIIQDNAAQAGLDTRQPQRTFTILSDSQSAVQAIMKPTSRSGQSIVYRILQEVEELKTQGIGVRLCWVPAHRGNIGNELADKLAKQAVNSSEDHDYHRPISAYKATIHARIVEEWHREWATSPKGKHLKRIDDGLPAKRALRVYGSLSRHHTYILTQLRSGHSWLASYGMLRKWVNDDKCVCGAVESVVHVLIDCPLLRELRQKLRNKVGDAFNCIASLLGGCPRNGQGQVGNQGNERNVLKAVLEFADASQRFKSRASAAESREQHRPQRG